MTGMMGIKLQRDTTSTIGMIGVIGIILKAQCRTQPTSNCSLRLGKKGHSREMEEIMGKQSMARNYTSFYHISTKPRGWLSTKG